jgi:hypothetical protein
MGICFVQFEAWRQAAPHVVDDRPLKTVLAGVRHRGDLRTRRFGLLTASAMT